MSSIALEYVLDCSDLAPESEESNPQLWTWSSTTSKFNEQKIQWDSDDKRISKGRITIPIVSNNNGKFDYDASIGIRLVVESPNHEGLKCISQAGNVLVFIRDIVDSVKSNSNKYTSRKSVVLRSLTKNVKKAEITITLLNGMELSRLSFEQKTMYSICEENHIFLNQVTNVNSKRELVPFMDVEGLQGWRGLYDAATKLHDPIWSTELDVPSIFFWIDSNREIQEEVLKNCLEICLKRRNMTLANFMDISRRQFSEMKNKISDEFVDVVRVFGDSVGLISNSLRYKSDETHRNKKKSRKHKKDQSEGENDQNTTMLELFMDAYTYLSGDCEDTAKFAYFIFMSIRKGDEKYKEESVPYKKHGGWRSEEMDMMQRIAFQYIGMGTLAIVTSRWLGEKDGKMKNESVIIDSKEDKNVEEGGHMFDVLLPIPYFEDCVNNIMDYGEEKFHVYPSGTLAPWAPSLPVLAIEGTGWMDPFLKPETEYYKTEDAKQKAMERAKVKVNLLMNIAKRTWRIKRSQLQSIQTQVVDKEGMRLSKFYRYALSCTSDLLLREGFRQCRFIWVTDVKKRKAYKDSKHIAFWDNDDDDHDDNCHLKVGANIRDIVYKQDYIGLFVIPGIEVEELMVAKSKLKHFMPNRPVTLTRKAEIKVEWENKMKDFKMNLDEAIRKKEKKQKTPMESMFTYEHSFDFVMRGQESFLEISRKEIIADIMNFPEIVGYEMEIEVVTDLVVNVRIRLFAEIVETPHPPFEYEKQKPKGKDISSEEPGRSESASQISRNIESIFDDVKRASYSDHREEILNQNDETKARIASFMKASFVSPPVLIEWEHNEKEKGDASISKLYTFEDDEVKHGFIQGIISQSIQSIHPRYPNYNDFSNGFQKGVKIAKRELTKLSAKIPTVLVSHRDIKKYHGHPAHTHNKIKVFVHDQLDIFK